MTNTPARLATLKVAELHALAAELGIDSAKLRKGELIDAIVTAQGGSSALSNRPADASASPEGASDADSSRPRRSRRVQSASAETHVNVAGGSGTDLVPTQDDGVATLDKDEDSSESGGSRNSRRGRNRNRNQDRASDRASERASGESESESESGDQSTRDDARDGEGNGRNRNRRDRNRNRRTSDEFEPEILEDDVLIPIAGILDVLDNYAFVRTTGYLPGASDVYVSLGQVRKYNLRRGDAVVGAVKQPREGETNSRQKYNALVSVDRINGLTVEEAAKRSEFADLTALYPIERLRLETTRDNLTGRLLDVVAPTGKGQRTLIVAPPHSGVTTMLHHIAEGVSVNAPEAHLMVVVLDERPEEVTALSRTIKGELIASTFDRSAEDHTTIAELAIERAKRLVELGLDVVVLLDSITALGRAFQATAPLAHRPVGTIVDASALHPVKKLFGAARKIENGGSLTVFAVADIETGASIDQAILDEFLGTANSEIYLSADLALAGEYPAIDVTRSSTRHDELFLSSDEHAITRKLRRDLAPLSPADALARVIRGVKNTGSNVEYLVSVQRSLAE